MAIELDISSDSLDDESLQAFARDLNQVLQEADGVVAELGHHEAIQGDRGGALIIGKILLDLAKSSAAGALIETLGAYFNRERSVQGKISMPDGTILEIDARNLRSGEFEQTLQAMLASTAKG